MFKDSDSEHDPSKSSSFEVIMGSSFSSSLFESKVNALTTVPPDLNLILARSYSRAIVNFNREMSRCSRA